MRRKLFFLMIRRPPRSTQSRSSAASDVYKKQLQSDAESYLKGQVGDYSGLNDDKVDDLIKLYQKCGLFVFPSTVETFGNPLVEAMACGAPIASSNAAAMPEVLGDAGLYFDPNKISDIRDTILKVLSDEELRNSIGQLAEARSHEFHWEKAEAKTKLAFQV